MKLFLSALVVLGLACGSVRADYTYTKTKTKTYSSGHSYGTPIVESYSIAAPVTYSTPVVTYAAPAVTYSAPVAAYPYVVYPRPVKVRSYRVKAPKMRYYYAPSTTEGSSAVVSGPAICPICGRPFDMSSAAAGLPVTASPPASTLKLTPVK